MKLTESGDTPQEPNAAADIAVNGATARPGANGNTRSRKGRRGKAKQPTYDPFQMRDKTNATSDGGALLHLVKSSLGSGILAMPNAFKNGGLLFGLVGTMAIGVLCTYCIYLLVLCSQTLARRIRRPALGFSETAAAAFVTGPRRFRSWGPFAREFVNAALFCTYYFGTTVYVVFVAASFKQVADSHTPPEWHYSVRAWIMGLALPLIPLGIIRTLRVLVPFSAMATVFILVGLGCTMSWVIIGASPFAGNSTMVTTVPMPDISSRPWIAPICQMPLFFATVLFAMEGIGTVLPIENSMRHPQRFLTSRPCGILNTAMTLIVCLYTVAGFLGYLRFGDDTDGSITLNLPNDLFAEAVKLLVALSILFSYGLQFCVPSEIVWNRLEPWLRRRRNEVTQQRSVNTVTGSTITMTTTLSSTNNTSVVEEKKQIELETVQSEEPMDGAYYIMRASMILGTVFIAALVPDLAPFISLIGAVFFSILGLMCPAVIHLVAFWDKDDDDDGEFEMNDYDDNSNEDDDFGDEVDLQEQDDNDVGVDDTESPVDKSSGMSRWAVATDVAIIIIALVALVSGTYASLVDIIALYGGGSGDEVAISATNGTAFVNTTIGLGPQSTSLMAAPDN